MDAASDSELSDPSESPVPEALMEDVDPDVQAVALEDDEEEDEALGEFSTRTESRS
jgi:hypothetical protein